MWPVELGGTPPTLADGTTTVPYDPFHDLIWMDELTRMGAAGVLQGFGIQTMALPVVLRFAPPEVQRKVVPGVVRGEKFISLCISEPTAGSDVADIRTTAQLTADGRHYIVNGLKKWITWAVHADFFTVAVRTGEPGSGSKGISLLLLEKTMPGITLRRMKLQGNWAGGTCLVEFSDVKVPVGNLIGELNRGFKAIMINFNHERFQIAVQASRSARMCLEEAVAYAKRRRTFGKRLVDHQVIRHKIAEMASIVESLHAQLEQCAFQMKHAGGAPAEQQRLGAVLSLLKVQASKGFEKCAREASQIIGGSAYTRGGKGGVVERLYREVRSVAIPGGSEEIMLVSLRSPVVVPRKRKLTGISFLSLRHSFFFSFFFFFFFFFFTYFSSPPPSPTLPYPTLPYPTLPYRTLSSPSLPYPILPYPTPRASNRTWR